MPCNSSHMEPTRHEAESLKIARLLVWVYSNLNRKLPQWVTDAANNCYGDKDKVHELTALLCTTCKRLNENIIYNGRDRTARTLANWWDDHQYADKMKEEVRLIKENKERLQKSAWEKLTPEERAALG